MKDGHWIALHKKVKYWLPKDRDYTELEAMISHTIDIDENKSWSINGYSKLWGWSRNKVKMFLANIRSELGHHRDTHKYNARAKHGQGVLLKLNDLQWSLDIERSQLGQTLDTAKDTTINPNTKPNKKIVPDSPSRESVKGGGGGGKNGKFKVPTLEEVTVYCKDRNSVVDPQNFLDSNETKGWVVGKLQTPMKCWKAAIRTWETNAKKYNPTQQVSRPNQKSDVDKMMEAYGENN